MCLSIAAWKTKHELINQPLFKKNVINWRKVRKLIVSSVIKH